MHCFHTVRCDILQTLSSSSTLDTFFVILHDTFLLSFVFGTISPHSHLNVHLVINGI